MSGPSSSQQLTLQVCYTPHTTPADADFVIESLKSFRPHVYIPEEPDRSPRELDKLTARHTKLISGEKGLEKSVPNYGFHLRMLEGLRDYRRENVFLVYFLELNSEDTVKRLKVLHNEQINRRKRAWSMFESGELENACSELYESLVLHAEIVKTRAESIRRNAEELPGNLQETFPEIDFDGRRVMAWLSGLYAPPVIQFDGTPYTVIEKFQRTPYPQLTHVVAVRKLVLGESVDKNSLARAFIENPLEEYLRDKIPDSTERFEKCRSVRVTYDDVNNISKRVRQGMPTEELAEALLKDSQVSTNGS